MERILIILQGSLKKLIMNKYLTLLSLLFISVISFGQVKLEQEFTETNEDAILYRIEGKDVKKQSYILGTMHMIDAEKYYFPEGLKNLIAKQKQIVMELKGVPNQFEILPKLMLPQGKSLSDYFTTTQYDSIKTFFAEKLKVDDVTFESSFAKMKPFVIIQTMSMIPDSTKIMMSIDKTIYDIADENKKEVIGLETIEQQLGFFDVMETDDVSGMIMKSIHEVDTSTLLTRMETAYASQSLSALAKIMDSGEEELDKETLLYGRNEKWVPLIKEYIKSKSSFIAVGAGHLYGDKGVLELLRKQGYKVTGLKMIDKNEK